MCTAYTFIYETDPYLKLFNQLEPNMQDWNVSKLVLQTGSMRTIQQFQIGTIILLYTKTLR